MFKYLAAVVTDDKGRAWKVTVEPGQTARYGVSVWHTWEGADALLYKVNCDADIFAALDVGLALVACDDEPAFT